MHRRCRAGMIVDLAIAVDYACCHIIADAATAHRMGLEYILAVKTDRTAEL